MSGAQADVFVSLLEEFGPDYFEHTQSVRISAGTYRLVAPYIKDKALHVNGETLDLNSANVQKVASSVRESQRALPLPALGAPESAPAPAPAPEESAAVPILSERLTAVSRRAMAVIADYREVARDARETEPSLFFQSMLRGSLARVSDELARVGHENGLVV
jgi:hypothetical protein